MTLATIISFTGICTNSTAPNLSAIIQILFNHLAKMVASKSFDTWFASGLARLYPSLFAASGSPETTNPAVHAGTTNI